MEKQLTPNQLVGGVNILSPLQFFIDQSYQAKNKLLFVLEGTLNTGCIKEFD